MNDDVPTPQEAARRLLVLKHVIVHAFSGPPADLREELMQKWNIDEQRTFLEEGRLDLQKTRQSIVDYGLEDAVTPNEWEWLSKSAFQLTHQEQADGSWRMESAHVLMWALGLKSRLNAPDAQSDPSDLKRIPDSNTVAFIEDAALRDTEEIEDAREIAELWLWRCRKQYLDDQGEIPRFETGSKEAEQFRTFDDIVRHAAKSAYSREALLEIKDEDFVAFGKAFRDVSEEEWHEIRSISMERLFALNWLCGYAPDNEWDETPTDT